MKLTDHFDSTEFKCNDGCGLNHTSVDIKIIEVAEKIREKLGEPVIINSSCRCSRHLAVKKKCSSDALDITARDFDELVKVAKEVNSKRFTIIYINKHFVHIDLREDNVLLTKWDI
jgi:hypothetical protein